MDLAGKMPVSLYASSNIVVAHLFRNSTAVKQHGGRGQDACAPAGRIPMVRK